MPSTERESAILLADITGSTPLYEAVGDAAALRQIADCVDRLQAIVQEQDGKFLRSKGDDVLCTFKDPSSALRAVRRMLSVQSRGSLAIHAGIHYGRVIHARGDIFGDAVNLTARLATLAKSGEVLISRNFVDRLPGAEVQSLRLLDTITFKGKSESTEVYSLLRDDTALRTEAAFGRGFGQTRMLHQLATPELSVTLRYGGRLQTCEEGASFTIGRSAGCDLVIGQPWVSRKHATVSVRQGKVQLEDSSSSGTYVTTCEGDEFFMRRETMILPGSGIISPALQPSEETAEVIHFTVDRREREDGP